MKRYFIFAAALALGLVLHPHSADAACGKDTNAIKVITRDANGTLLGGMNVAVYHKYIDPDGNPYVWGGAIASAQTDPGGQTGILCVSAKQAPYSIKVYQKNPNYGYFMYWEISENGPLNPSIVNVNLGGWQVIFRDAQGGLLKNVVFDVYLQSFDVDGNPVVDVTKLNSDKLIASDFNTQVFGTTRVYLTPGHYVMRVHGTGSSYFYLWNQEVNAETEDLIEYHLATMRFVFENGFGSVVKNQQFTVYRQISDVRGKTIYGQLVASGLTTGPTGKIDTYLPPDTYAIKVAGSGGTFYKSYGYTLAEEEYRVVTYRMSGVRLVLRGANNALARTTRFSFATQRNDALGKPIVNKYLLRNQSTGEPGYMDIYVPAGTYMVVVGKQRVPQVDVFDRQFTSLDWPKTVTYRLNGELTLTTPLSNKMFVVRRVSGVNLPRYLGGVDRVSGVYRLQASPLKAGYAVSFTTTSAKLEDMGVDVRSLRIAYYSQSKKRWSLVGKVNAARYQVTATLRDRGYAALVAVY